jgi:hypothetical protein
MNHITPYYSKELVMAYRLDGWGLILSTGKRFFSTFQCPDHFWSPPGLLSSGYQRLFLWGGGIIKHRDIFTFTLL